MNGTRGRYFFVSYAHSPPLAGLRPASPDEWVRSFFRDLTRMVQRHATAGSELAPGFIDMEIPLDANWKSEIVDALGAAEVFVPLYSPGYLTRSWPNRELECFKRRMAMAGIHDPVRRFAPVLWVPLPVGEQPDGLETALELASDDDGAPYTQSGLLALRRLQPYRGAYNRVVDRLAQRIVRMAENDPVGPSRVPDIDQIDSDVGTGPQAPVFRVVVAAPISGALPPGAPGSVYGESAVDWRPFADEQGIPLVEYARMVGEQLDFSVRVTDIASTDRDKAFERGPGILLVDPWYIARERERKTLGAFLRDAPSWMVPVLGPGVDSGSEKLLDEAGVMLRKARSSASRQVQRAMRGVTTLEDFVHVLPFLVAEAGREYLRRGPITRSPRPASPRPTLSGRSSSTAPDEQASLYGEVHNPAKERPDG